MSKLPTIERKQTEPKQEATAIVHEQPLVVATVQIETKSIPINLPVMFGLDIGDPRRNVQVRLKRDEATTLRRIVDAFDQSEDKPSELRGRRANEQDWLRYFLRSIASKLP